MKQFTDRCKQLEEANTVQYTVITLNADTLGDVSSATQDDLDRYNGLVADELAVAGLDGQYRVEASFNGDGVLPTWDDELTEAVARAWERFCEGEQVEA